MPASRCTFTVTFKPTATGTRSGTVQITDNAAGSPHSVSLSGTGTSTTSTVPEPAGWYAGDMHVHRSCGYSSPEAISSVFSKMTTNNLAVASLLADMGNGEVRDPAQDLPRVNGSDDPVSTGARLLHWDAECHWDPDDSTAAHHAIGGHIVLLGINQAQTLWKEYHVSDPRLCASARGHRRLRAHGVPRRQHPADRHLLRAAGIPGRSRAGHRRLHLRGHQRERQRLPDRRVTTACSIPASGRGSPRARTTRARAPA